MKRTFIIVASFIIFFFLWYNNILVKNIDGFIHYSLTAHYTANYLLSGIVLLFALLLLHKPGNILSSLGLSGGFGRAALFGLVCMLPMLLGYAIVGKFNHPSLDHLACRIVIAGLFEEIVFRGFIFGQLFRYARWGFLPAALLAGIVFGALHLYQGDDLSSAFAAFGVTAMGSLFFSWIYVERNYNLWYPIWLHVLMNAPWIIFSVNNNAVGGIAVNILRCCTIGLAIGLTILYKRKSQLPYHITPKTLFINKVE